MNNRDDVVLLFARMICLVVLAMVVSACIGGLWYGKPISSSPFADHLESILSAIIGFISGSYNRDKST